MWTKKKEKRKRTKENQQLSLVSSFITHVYRLLSFIFPFFLLPFMMMTTTMTTRAIEDTFIQHPIFIYLASLLYSFLPATAFGFYLKLLRYCFFFKWQYRVHFWTIFLYFGRNSNRYFSQCTHQVTKIVPKNQITDNWIPVSILIIQRPSAQFFHLLCALGFAWSNDA